jgi:ligand-binding sensor domain-containing protein
MILLPMTAWAGTEDKDNWKRFGSEKYMYSLVAVDDYLWAGIDGGIKVFHADNPELQRFYHRLNSGLKANQVYTVAVDGQGGVWLGTDNGAIYRSGDGSWSYFTRENSPLTVNNIQAIAVDELGGVWFGTWGGGAYYLDQNKNWHSYHTLNSPLPGNRIYAIALVAGGGVWVGTDNRGAAYLSPGGNWEVFNAVNSDLPGNDVLDIGVDSTGGVWFGTYQGVGYRSNTGEWQVFQAANSLLPGAIFYSLAVAPDDSVWAGTGGGVARLTKEGEFEFYIGITDEKAIDSSMGAINPDTVIKSIAVDPSGRVWLGTWGEGLMLLEQEGESPGNVRSIAGVGTGSGTALAVSTHLVNDILPLGSQERLEKVWFGTEQGAVAFTVGTGRWEHVDMGRGPQASNQIKKVVQDSTGRVVFVNGGELAILSTDGSWQHLNGQNGELWEGAVVNVAVDNHRGGQWLAVEDGGVVYLSNDGSRVEYSVENSGLPGEEINDILLDELGNVWFGTWGGGAVKLTSAGTWDSYNSANSKLPVNDVMALAMDTHGNTWLGTWGGGLARVSASGEWTIYNTATSSLPSNVVRALAVDARGWVWAATAAGAAFFNGDEWQVLTTNNSGLPAGSLRAVSTDNQGNVWFATVESGVAVYNPAGLAPELAGLPDISQQLGEIGIYLENRYLISDASPVLEHGRTLVPMRLIFEALGAQVDWVAGERKVSALLGDKELTLTIDDNIAYLNGEPIVLDVPARLIGERTMVPLRFVGESLGLKVDWDPVLRMVILKEVGDGNDN